MVGLIFTICLLTLLAAVGFLFAWMVRLASEPQPMALLAEETQGSAALLSSKKKK